MAVYMEINLAEGIGIGVQEVMTGRGCVIGQSGSGKSFLAGVIAEELCKADMPFCVIDTEGEYSSLKGMFNVIVAGGEHQDIGLDVDFSRLFDASISSHVPVVLDLSDVVEREDVAYKALEALYALEDRIRKPYLVIIEEADKLAPQVVRKKINIIEEISVRGRKRGIGLFITTQRPANISKNVLAQCSYGFVGKLTIENDFNALRILFSRNEKLAQITKLGVGEFIPFGLDFDEEFKVKARSARHTSATPSVEGYRPMDGKISNILKELKGGRYAPRMQDNRGRRSKPANLPIEAMPVSLTPDEAKAYAERISRKKFVIFGDSTESIDSIDLKYVPLGLCSMRIPTNRKNEFREFYCIVNDRYELTKLGKSNGGVRSLTVERMARSSRSNYMDYLRKDRVPLQSMEVPKDDLVSGQIDIKRANVCIRKFFHTAIIMDFRTVYLPAYRITLRNDNKVRVFWVEGMYGTRISPGQMAV